MSVSLTLRKCTSERNRLDKSFVSGADIPLTGTFKEGQSILFPEFTIESTSDLSGYNYCEISDFGRNYFLKATAVQTGIWKLSLEVDVLSTYATGIKASKAFVKRTEEDSKINYFMNDGALYTEQREVITYHDFMRDNEKADFGTPSYYLLVAGG